MIIKIDPSKVPAKVPTSCTRGQGRLALLDAGYLMAVEAMIAGIADPQARIRAQIEYERETWERNNPFLQQMWANLGGTPAELDALFIDAVAQIELQRNGIDQDEFREKVDAQMDKKRALMQKFRER